jgi:capsular polysaccharide transport system permease protein
MTVDTSAGSPPKYILWTRRLQNRLRRIDALTKWTVVAPTVLAVLYFGLYASDVYVAESRFVVRSQQNDAPVTLGNLIKGNTSSSTSIEDTYSVRDFMLSRDALRQLEDELHLSAMFSSSDVDRPNRFAGLDFDDSFEGLHEYYGRRVSIHVDSTSSISMLEVSAFSAHDAYRINDMLLQIGERFVNGLNEQARQDTVRFAEQEATAAAEKAKEAALALSSYRSRHSLFNPEAQSTMRLQQVSKLQDELISTRTQLAQLRTLAPESPQIPALQRRIQSLQAQEAEEMGKAAGKASRPEESAEFERLALEREFADKQLETALASLEQARNEARRKVLYLARIVQPREPDIATRPKRVRAIITTFVLGLIVWGVLTILLAGLREHQD